MLKIGVVKANINPPLTLPHAGWGAQSHVYAEGIEADFWTRVLVISDDTATSVLVDLDVSHLTFDQAVDFQTKMAKRLEIEPESIRISTTHTHAGPLIWFDYYENSKTVRLNYLDYMLEQTVGAAIQARNQLEIVTVGAGYGQCDVGKHRRQKVNGRMVVGIDDEGFTDPTVGTIRFDNESGETVASIVHYACHPTILGPDNKLMSPEYPGVTKQVVEELIGGTCLFLLGAAGNIGPGPEGFKTNYEAMRRIGTTIGVEAAKILLNTHTTKIDDEFERIQESGASLALWNRKRGEANDDTFKVISRWIKMPLKEQVPVEEAKKEAYEYKKKLEYLQKNAGSEEDIRAMTFKVKRSFMTLERSELYYGKTHKPIQAHFIRIGESVLIGMPVEPFSEIGAAIREQSPFLYTMFSGYSNGWVGYLPIRNEYPRGGYEVDTTAFSPDAADHLIKEIINILHEIKKENSI